jgi:hypothetical protein
MLAGLEERVARGELSLRGVNTNIVDIDPQLLVDVDTPDELAAIIRGAPPSSASASAEPS